MEDPANNPIRIPDLVEFGRTLQTLLAGLVIAFDPITAGSGACGGGCTFLPPALDYPGIVKFIGDLWPGNKNIDEWLAAYNKGKANVPTQEQIDLAIRYQQSEFWDFANPSPPAEWSRGFNLSTLAPVFHKLWTDLGLNPPPLNPPAPDQETGSVNELRAPEKVSEPTLPLAVTPNLTTVNLKAAPVAQDSQVKKDVSTDALQDVQSIPPAATGAPADAAAVPSNADTRAGQTADSASKPVEKPVPIEMTRDGNMAVPGKVGGNGTNSRGGLRGALRSAADQISSSISNVTSGSMGGTNTGKTSTGKTGTAGPRPANPAPAGPRLANPAPAAARPANPAPAGIGLCKEWYRLWVCTSPMR